MMNPKVRNAVAIISTGVWVNASEFFRNEFLLKKYWIAHFKLLGMTFPTRPVNGIMWMIWGFLYAIAIFSISRKFSLMQTTLLGWLVGFLLMWIVIWNLNVLPRDILVYAAPLSLLEVLVALIQAYVITFLAAIFIGMAVHQH